jgi:hypothetical protein
MGNYDTLSAALNSLKERGFNKDFNIAFDKIICADSNECLNPHEFTIIETYRFEGETNPSDEAVLYAIESNDGTTHGVFVSAYGVYADTLSDEMLQKLAIRH